MPANGIQRPRAPGSSNVVVSYDAFVIIWEPGSGLRHDVAINVIDNLKDVAPLRGSLGSSPLAVLVKHHSDVLLWGV